jgi:signal transduction histidine kinase
MIAEAVETAEDRVLVIDDERGPRESLRFLLKNEFEVFCAESVDRGVERLREDQVELVVMDIRMPGKDGIEGLFEIRKVDRQVSVVMLTGYGTLETAQQALRLGATDYLNKPFEADEMRQIVRRYVQRTKLERRRAAMLVELEDVNSQLTRDLVEKERMAKLGQSSAELVHDLRNPLMIVGGYVELLARDLDKAREMMGGEYERAAEYLEVIEKNVKRCNELAHTWHKFGNVNLSTFEPTPVERILTDLMAGVELLAFAENVEVDCAVETPGLKVNGSHAQLLRALHNVVSNAIHAVTPGSGRVHVRCRPEAERVEFAVGDNGCGMTPEVIGRMFDPYFTTKTNGKGTGLGMAITKRIVEEHGGSIHVESTLGKGSLVTIRLPAVSDTTPAAAPGKEGGSPGGGN